MNFNDHLNCKGRGRGRNLRKAKNDIIQIMGPQIKKASSKKDSTPSTSLNWGKSANNIFNASSLLRSGGSSKTSSEIDSRVIVAITEGRGEARCEVGLAAINISRPALVLCQISDSQSYINILTKINILNPQEVLMPKTFVDNFTGNRLIDKIKKHFTKIKFTSVARNTFNKNRGIERIQELCNPSLDSVLLILKHKYYALAAASALLTYTNSNLNIYYVSGTLKVDYQESEGYAFIDVSTADRLELVSSTRPTQGSKYSSLFGVLNKCFTKIGARTLRSTILQPLYDVERIEERLNCLADLIKNPEMLISIQEILQKVSNIDQLLTIATIMPDDAQSCSNRQLNYILQLNTLVDLISPLKDILKNSKLKFFLDLSEFLSSQFFAHMKSRVRDIIHDEAHPAAGPGGIYQRCFAIKAGVNGLLDMVRTTYSERIEEMREYVKNLADKYDLPLTVGNNNSKGYHIVLALNKYQRRHMKKSDLPPEFIQVCRLCGSFTMKTAYLMNLSTRIDDILVDVLKISNVMVYQIISDMKQYIPVFHRLCEDIAQLDMLQSLAKASVGYSYVRPTFSDYTEIHEAHHPLLDFLCSTKPVANSVSASKDYNVHVVTGPSSSGKSIFIRQVMLLQVLAQIGCYVPAESAVFRPADRMFSRIYLEDDMEFGVSSFVLEMKEIKYIMTTMTENSLIIIDELCRSTSLEEGMALAIAICEKLASTSSFLYITTHFTTLARIYDMYLNIKTWQLETATSGDTPQTTKLDFRYNVIPGVSTINHYGVYMVRNIWPDEVLKLVEETLNNMTVKFNNNLKMTGINSGIRLKYDFESKLRQLKTQEKLTRSEINKHFNEFQNKIDMVQYSTQEGNQSDAYSQISVNRPPHYNISLEETGDNEHVEENPTPLFVNNLLSPDVSQVRESENYRNISMFLNENSDNVNMLIPEVNLFYEETSQENIPFFTPADDTLDQYETASCSSDVKPLNEFCFALPLLKDTTKTSTPQINKIKKIPLPPLFSPVTPNADLRKYKDIDMQSLQEDLEVCSQVFSRNDSFEEEHSIHEDLEICSQVFSKCDSFEDDEETKKMDNNNENYIHGHHYKNYLSPKVMVIEGPNNKSLSYGGSSDMSICTQFEARISFEDENALKDIPLITDNLMMDVIRGENSEENDHPSNKINFSRTNTVADLIQILNREDKNDIISSNANKTNASVSEEDDEIEKEKTPENKINTVEYVSTEYETPFENFTKDENISSDEYFSTDNKKIAHNKINTTNKTPEKETTSEKTPSSCYKIEIIKEKEKFAASTSSKTCTIDTPTKNITEDLSSIAKKRKISDEDTPTNNTRPSIDVGSSAKKTGDNSSLSNFNNNTTRESSIKESDSELNSRKKLKRHPVKKKLTIPTTPAIESCSSQSKRKTTTFRTKFVPPRKLTSKEIREEFKEQDRKLLETDHSNSSEFSKYLEQFVNRPTIKQVQNQTHVLHIKKTEDGVKVMPVQQKKRKRKKCLISQKRWTSAEKFDASIFSDKNAKPFEEFLNSNESDLKMFNFAKSSTKEKTSKNQSFNFPPVEFGAEDIRNSIVGQFNRSMQKNLTGQYFEGQPSTNPGNFLVGGNQYVSKSSTDIQTCFQFPDSSVNLMVVENVANCSTEVQKCFTEYSNYERGSFETFPLPNHDFETGKYPMEDPDTNIQERFNNSLLQTSQTNVYQSINNNSQSQNAANHSISSFLPSGYYKENKEEINRIMGKYLGSSKKSKTSLFENKSFSSDISL